MQPPLLIQRIPGNHYIKSFFFSSCWIWFSEGEKYQTLAKVSLLKEEKVFMLKEGLEGKKWR